ncbi:MAG TPA: cation:proton antiporter [Frankiaceae bacterium]|jgi:CPA2 family monovalent cation:H+ antiporter-2|nr:cation:proton antiporter [Frankiaceae bacterium]
MDGHGYAVLSEIGAVLLALGILGRFAGRLGVSPIPLYLLGGLAFGHGGVLALSASSEFISTGAQIGVLLLLLTLGLEYSADQLVANLRTNAGAGAVDLVLGAAPGAVAGLVLGWGLPGSLVLAGVTAVSSSGIISKLIADLGRRANPETPVVVSILVLEDLAMAIYLPVLTAVLAEAGVVRGVVTVAIALGTVSVVLLIATRWSHHFSWIVSRPGPHDSAAERESLLLRVLGITLLVAGLAEQLQVSAAVGAFLVGIALVGPVAEVARKVLAPLRDLFAAVFFVFFGLQTDPTAIPPVLLAAAVLALLSAVGKVATGWWAAGRRGIDTGGRVRAGTTLISHGEFSIVIAGLAVSSGQPARLGALAASYVLLLAIVGPLAARAADSIAGRLGASRALDSGHATRRLHR